MTQLDVDRVLAAAARRTIAPWQSPPERASWLFEAGLPDPATFPVDDLVRLSAEVLHADAAGALQYGAARDAETTSGSVGLRDAVAARARRVEGLAIDHHHVMLTAGSASALALLFEAFVDPGDAVAVEVPTWNTNIATLARRGADTIPLPIADDDGFSIDELEAVLDRLASEGRHLKLVYTIATFNTPSGVSLSLERRRRLVELARRWNFVVIEDNVYRELRYDGEHLPSLLALDPYGVVVRVDSFSKVVAPAMRLGWITAPPEILRVLNGMRGDLGVSQWTARIVERFVREGLLDRHIESVVSLYRAKRDAAERALHEHADPWVRWRTPEGGFFLWVELDQRVDPARVMAHALDEGVLCRTGERFFAGDPRGDQFFRLAFPAVPIPEIERGMAVLGRAVRASLR
jgi:2-aminoadipate transaminase